MGDETKKIFEMYENYMYGHAKYLNARMKSTLLGNLHTYHQNMLFRLLTKDLNNERLLRQTSAKLMEAKYGDNSN